MTEDGEQPPTWYFVIGGALALWNAIGCYLCYMEFIHGPDAMGEATAYDRALHAALPAWYTYLFALAVLTGLLGSIALLTRSASARILFLVSLLAAIVQFGYLFATTDLIAHKGPVAAMGFPIVIVAIGIAALWFAGLARRNEWLH